MNKCPSCAAPLKIRRLSGTSDSAPQRHWLRYSPQAFCCSHCGAPLLKHTTWLGVLCIVGLIAAAVAAALLLLPFAMRHGWPAGSTMAVYFLVCVPLIICRRLYGQTWSTVERSNNQLERTRS
jgi:hypothetical protein